MRIGAQFLREQHCFKFVPVLLSHERGGLSLNDALVTLEDSLVPCGQELDIPVSV